MGFFEITLLAAAGVVGLIEFLKKNISGLPTVVATIISAVGCIGVSVILGLSLPADLNPFGSIPAYIGIMSLVQLLIHQLGYDLIVKGIVGLLHAAVEKLKSK